MRANREKTYDAKWRLVRAGALLMLVAALMGVVLAQTRLDTRTRWSPSSNPASPRMNAPVQMEMTVPMRA